MVQVDVFWSYALGAGFAVAATRQLKTLGGAPSSDAHPEVDTVREAVWYENRWLTMTLLYLSLLFAPSGVCLLWAYPSWETMHVFDRNLSEWIVAAFAVTNVALGVLGFWVVWKLVRKGWEYLAYLQVFFGYLCMFFILVHGWDGTGYRRFFSSTPEKFQNWRLGNIYDFFFSDVAVTLYLMGIVLIPVLLWMITRFITDGYKLGHVDAERLPENVPSKIARKFLATVFVGSLGGAIIASLLIHMFGWLIGLAIFAGLAYFVLLRPGAGYLYKLYDDMMLPLPD